MVGVSQQVAMDMLTVLSLGRVVLGLVITTLAMIGYRNNRSHPMLALAVGVAFLTFVQVLLSIVMARLGEPYLISLSTMLAELVGLSLILYSIVLARRQ
ncbi:hypothetical protein D8Y22_13415 [Salinadaptatus halalkaliphilus]|uniref:Uncharacterized protein n=1 Tax=Salinadaptatus halalkaliphilus TaxID=2419781 RepID=A0A4S3TMW3_9EURY|nr:hypothetical protein [Salinadaptatus halalkaliphilus]THE64405.1 hypothetical protein D8Y22_13415 [Salinadaptatus halalkaliphilus]